MRRPIPLLAALSLTGLSVAVAAGFGPTAAPPPEPDVSADALLRRGDFADALEQYRKGLGDGSVSGAAAADALRGALDAVGRLGTPEERDGLIDAAVAAHPSSPRVRSAAATGLLDGPHWGTAVGGEFTRGQRRDRVRRIDVTEWDRTRALQLLAGGLGHLDELGDGDGRADYFFLLDRALDLGRGGNHAWRLQRLTDLSTLPDRTDPDAFGRPAPSDGAPVGADGEPVFYGVPESWDAADSDGARRRWALARVAAVGPVHAARVTLERAAFLRLQFGVRTLRGWAGLAKMLEPAAGGEPAPGPWSLHTLADDETIAKLATGVRRFTLPDDQDHVVLLRSLVESDREDAAVRRALLTLAAVHEDRRQFPRAAELYRAVIRRFPGDEQAERQLAQITDDLGVFEPTPLQPAPRGVGAAGADAPPPTLTLRYRNADSVSLSARPIDEGKLFADVKAYLKNPPAKFDWRRAQFGDLADALIRQNRGDLLGEPVTWSVDLDPPADHADARETFDAPVREPGAYLVTTTFAGGHVARTILQLEDTAVLRKDLADAGLFAVTDARTGEPLRRAKVEFFGWTIDHRRDDRPVVQTTNFAEFTDADGLIRLGTDRLPRDRQWVAAVRSPDGRFALLSTHGVYQQSLVPTGEQVSAYTVTDRPVYRPEQTVKFKTWVRRFGFGTDLDTGGGEAGVKLWVRLTNPRNETVDTLELVTDEHGGADGEFSLGEEATLGNYTIQIGRARVVGSSYGYHNFRVEEYKKPEFEVTVDAPVEPVALGETVTAKISADFYFGGPVAGGEVHYKVTRTASQSRWYPSDPWDWLYGEGFWWFSPGYDWYPGWDRWGCAPPPPWWWVGGYDPPEVVADGTAELSEDGTYELKIDTSVAADLFGDTDHRYSITAEVTDLSRRTITGTGSVLAAREPFRVFAWAERGFVRPGDPVEVRFRAQTAADEPVRTVGELAVYRVTYEADGTPVETQVVSQRGGTPQPMLEADGTAVVTMAFPQDGQYRFAYTVTADTASGEQHTAVGGTLLNVVGRDTDRDGLRYNALELIPDRKTYEPGDTVELLVNTDRPGSTVYLFVRPENGVYPEPEVLRLTGKSTVYRIPVRDTDQPNMFVEAVTVSDGEVHTVARRIAVPPVDKSLEVAVEPSSETYEPGGEATVRVTLTDPTGGAVPGDVALTVYDRSVEYISGGPNARDIREHFWGSLRHHHPQTAHNLDFFSQNLLKPGETAMRSIGAFGDLIFPRDGELDEGRVLSRRKPARGAGFGGGGAIGIGGFFGGPPMPMSAAPMMRGGTVDSFMVEDAGFAGEQADFAAQAGVGVAGGEAAPAATPTPRSEFADTAYWNPSVTAGRDGTAAVTFPVPENLTGWKVLAWAVGDGTRVGTGEAGFTTRKDLLVRLQAPRFFTETDEVLLSAVVMSRLEQVATARVSLKLGGDTLEPLGGTARTVEIPACGETRVDWRVRAVRPGEAVVTMAAVTDMHSDAVEQTFPVQPHGSLRTESYTGTMKPEQGEHTLTFTIPETGSPERTAVEVRFSPSLAAAMVDAMPYLVSYPYGCTEQTLNRFLPTVLTQKLLLETGVDLAAVREGRANLNPQELGDPDDRVARAAGFNPAAPRPNPVWDPAEVERMVKTGVQRLTNQQNGDGGWGWFPGRGESNTYLTALIVRGLAVAEANGVAVVPETVAKGVGYLFDHHQSQELAKLRNADSEAKPGKRSADNLDALVFHTLTAAGARTRDRDHAAMRDYLFRDRLKLSLYSQALFGQSLALLNEIESDEREKLDRVLSNLSQFLVTDDENDTAYLRLPDGGGWWYWWNDGIEANAAYLELLATVDPENETAPRLVKYLLNNRANATWWKSTRDTALVLEAFTAYLRATGEASPSYDVEIQFDGRTVHTARVRPDNLFSLDNTLTLTGDAVATGEHTLTVRKVRVGGGANEQGDPLYWNVYAAAFDQSDFISAAGLEIKVARKVWRLTPDDEETAVAGDRGQAVDIVADAYDREELPTGAAVNSGDLVEVELILTSKNDYTFLGFEDYKAAGFEPLDVTSGWDSNGGLWAYRELRDERTVFFVEDLPRGRHALRYRLRAEVPGEISALPAIGYGMYAPELRGNSDEWDVTVGERE